jgi:acylphosphatase
MRFARRNSEMAKASNALEQMVLCGEFSAGSFVPWIEAYARKLGLTGIIHKAGPDRIELQLEGPPELVDAMEVGCLLGPIDIWVEKIERTADAQQP